MLCFFFFYLWCSSQFSLAFYSPYTPLLLLTSALPQLSCSAPSLCSPLYPWICSLPFLCDTDSSSSFFFYDPSQPLSHLSVSCSLLLLSGVIHSQTTVVCLPSLLFCLISFTSSTCSRPLLSYPPPNFSRSQGFLISFPPRAPSPSCLLFSCVCCLLSVVCCMLSFVCCLSTFVYSTVYGPSSAVGFLFCLICY
jgi:hypothetical protein